MLLYDTGLLHDIKLYYILLHAYFVNETVSLMSLTHRKLQMKAIKYALICHSFILYFTMENTMSLARA